MKRFFLFWILIVCALCSQCHQAHAGERYQLHWRQTVFSSANPYIEPQCEIWLHDELARKTLWKRTLYRSFHPTKSEIFWSKNRKALAISLFDNYFVWREGYRLRHFRAPSDYLMGFAWSPDNRRLLVRSDGSGASDLGCGGLYCLELGDYPRYKFFRIDVACEFNWVSRTKVRFTQINDAATAKDNASKIVFWTRYWRVPRNSIFHALVRHHAKRRRGR